MGAKHGEWGKIYKMLLVILTFLIQRSNFVLDFEILLKFVIYFALFPLLERTQCHKV